MPRLRPSADTVCAGLACLLTIIGVGADVLDSANARSSAMKVGKTPTRLLGLAEWKYFGNSKKQHIHGLPIGPRSVLALRLRGGARGTAAAVEREEQDHMEDTSSDLRSSEKGKEMEKRNAHRSGRAQQEGDDLVEVADPEREGWGHLYGKNKAPRARGDDEEDDEFGEDDFRTGIDHEHDDDGDDDDDSENGDSSNRNDGDSQTDGKAKKPRAPASISESDDDDDLEKHAKSKEKKWSKSRPQPLRRGSGSLFESRKLWHTVYAVDEGSTSICEHRFEARSASQYLRIEDDGKVVRNIDYGAGCARTAQPMMSGDWPMIHYIEMQVFGGTAPDPTFTGAEINGTWVPYGQDGMHCTSIGIIAGDSTGNFDDSTIPDDSFMWSRSGFARWTWDEDGDDSKLSALRIQDRRDHLVINHQDKIGVIVDFHMMKLGFTRNGHIVPDLTRPLGRVVLNEGLRFVVGGVRPNTRWVMLDKDAAMQTIMNFDWEEWLLPLPSEPHFGEEASVSICIYVYVCLYVCMYVQIIQKYACM
jgi:hypothetical protein